MDFDLDSLDSLIPVAIFAAGSLFTRAGQRTRDRREAALKLSHLRRWAWPTGEDRDWIDMQTYLGELRVALRAAGVPRRMEVLLRNAMEKYFRGATQVDDVGWVQMSEAAHLRLDQMESLILDWLDRPWHVLRRLRAAQAARALSPL